MTASGLVLASIGGGLLVAAVVALLRQRARIRGLQATLSERQAERLLPNRDTKFRVVYYTNTGVKARDFYKLATSVTGSEDLCEFWHYAVLRDKQ